MCATEPPATTHAEHPHWRSSVRNPPEDQASELQYVEHRAGARIGFDKVAPTAPRPGVITWHTERTMMRPSSAVLPRGSERSGLMISRAPGMARRPTIYSADCRSICAILHSPSTLRNVLSDVPFQELPWLLSKFIGVSGGLEVGRSVGLAARRRVVAGEAGGHPRGGVVGRCGHYPVVVGLRWWHPTQSTPVRCCHSRIRGSSRQCGEDSTARMRRSSRLPAFSAAAGGLSGTSHDGDDQ